jgi:hypothetical protein
MWSLALQAHGSMPHALERILPTSVLVAGYKLADSDGYAVTQAPEGTERGPSASLK